MKTHFVLSIFFPKIVEICGGAREATDETIVLRMRIACWISKATGAHAPGHRRTRTHREICNTYCFSTATVVL